MRWPSEPPSNALDGLVPRPIGLGLIGCGRIARSVHLPAIDHLSGWFELIAVADPNREMARPEAEKRSAVIEADGQALIRRDDIDAILIATPGPGSRARGRRLSREGPRRHSGSGRGRPRMRPEGTIRDHAGVRSGTLARTEPCRLGPAAIAAGDVGRVDSIYLAIRAPRGSRSKGGADVLTDLGPDALDIVLCILGVDVKTVYAEGGALFGEEFGTAILIITGKAGAVATVELSRCLPTTIPILGLGEVEIEVLGTEGVIRIEPLPGVTVASDAAIEARPLLVPVVMGSDEYASFSGSAEQADCACNLLKAARLSLETGEPISMDPTVTAANVKDSRP